MVVAAAIGPAAADRAALGRHASTEGRRSWPAVRGLRAVVEAKLERALVTAADRGLAVGGIPRRSGDAGVARDDLPVAVRADPRRAPQGTDPLSPSSAQQSPAGRQAVTQRPRSDPGHGQHSRTTRGGRRPAVPGHWEGDLLYGQGSGVGRDARRTPQPLRHARRPARRVTRADVVAAALAAKITELPEQLRRSLTWDQGREMARTRGLHHRHRRARLLLRPAQSLATRHQREHQRTVAPILPASQPTRRPQPSRPRRRSPPNSTVALDKPSAGGHHHKHSTRRCNDPLNPSPLWSAFMPGREPVRSTGGEHREIAQPRAASKRADVG